MKLKRFFTGVLSAVMALSVCALPAAADDATNVNDPTDLKLTASTIDTTQKGSITIHKYGRLEDPTAENGTGEVDTTVAANKDNKPLEGVDFTLYRVKTTADLLKYYDALKGASVEEFTAGDCFTATNESDWSATTLKPAYIKDATGDDTNAPVGKVGTAKTNAEGAAQFNSLPVGMYLVIETNKVQSVTKTVTPFLVSIPMTRIGDTASTGNNNLKQWLYDVVVYPKNSTAQGTVTLVKQGKHGDTRENLAGVMFKLFQYQDSKADYVDITDKLTNKTPVGTESYVVTASGTNLGKITFSDLPMGKYYVQEYGYTGADSDKGYIINTKGKYGFAIDKDGKVSVQTETGEGETDWVTNGDGFEANNSNGTITITNYKPEFEKTVESRTGTTSTDEHQADYGIGDKVPYTLTIKVPENVAKLHTFKVVDTTLEDQLKHIPDEFKLTATDKDDSPQTLTEKDAYTKEITVGKDAENKDTSILTVNFTPAKLASVAGGTITIKYYATLGAGAVVAENGNLNTAKLLYSRKTDTVDGTGETDKPYEITDEGVVYTFMTSIEKKGKGGSYDEAPMPGVTFALYRKVEGAEWNSEDKVTIAGQEYTKEGAVPGATAVELGLTTNKSETWVQIYHDGKLEAATNDNGIVEYKGLPSGTYKFIETKTLDKYNLLASPVDAKLSLSYTTKWKDTSKYDANGNLTNHKSETVKYKNGDAVVPDPNAVIKVVNRSGFTLPVTGGFGTLLFSGIGVLLVLAGVAVLFSMKKKNDRA
ncbi:SpaH/EbpB family LPXTG-anchored major pilin [Gemmiger formicilis]|uniref:SpaH/EbpB family LPXTG-anchored major pilin n=1 Tax=Gemmiger formicilis TaxID=745368 RepID=UPI0021086028|nr:SpaH/EbpB family LPXTG-anchored major pilin [Gemmiger formicilis]MCQ5080795.1 SpaH/EbpB family LPXTG-anchored major pilin [Gemmiger formicilis]MCQ5116337.1 SpaH/EbpB family LPXTG-anchored major pilin [Gemmiger formicilis]